MTWDWWVRLARDLAIFLACAIFFWKMLREDLATRKWERERNQKTGKK